MSELLTAGGMPIVHLQDAEVDERFVAMTENPFLHGCCDCGLFHRVEYKIVDAEGNELQIPEGAMLALRFSREEAQTEHFREERRAGEGVPIWKDLHDTAQDLLLDASIAGVAGARSPADMRLQAIQRYRTDPLFNARIRELMTRLLSAAMKHQIELEAFRRGKMEEEVEGFKESVRTLAKTLEGTIKERDQLKAEREHPLVTWEEGKGFTVEDVEIRAAVDPAVGGAELYTPCVPVSFIGVRGKVTFSPGARQYREGDKVRLLKDIWDDGEDHHPPGYLVYKGEVLIVRRGLREGGKSLAISHVHRLDASFSVTLDEVEPVLPGGES